MQCKGGLVLENLTIPGIGITGLIPVGFGGTEIIFLGFAFVAFLFIIRAAFGLIKNIAVIAVAAAIFPLAASSVGLHTPLNVSTFILFFICGVAAWFILKILRRG